VKTTLSPEIKLVELDAHINDESFARTAADVLLESLDATKGKGATQVR
jgi:hypothetical protein